MYDFMEVLHKIPILFFGRKFEYMYIMSWVHPELLLIQSKSGKLKFESFGFCRAFVDICRYLRIVCFVPRALLCSMFNFQCRLLYREFVA